MSFKVSYGLPYYSRVLKFKDIAIFVTKFPIILLRTELHILNHPQITEFGTGNFFGQTGKMNIGWGP